MIYIDNRKIHHQYAIEIPNHHTLYKKKIDIFSFPKHMGTRVELEGPELAHPKQKHPKQNPNS